MEGRGSIHRPEAEAARPPGRVRARHALAVAAALPVAALLVVLVFAQVEWRGGPVLVSRFDPRALVRTVPHHLDWLVPFVALAATLPALRAVVWRAVQPRPRVRYADAYHATALGALVHNTLPGKLGPLAAAWVLARTARRPLGPAFGSQLLSKLLEMGALVVLGAAAAFAIRPGAAVARAIAVGGGLFVALAAAAAALAVGAPAAAARIAARLPRAGTALAALGEGIAAVGGGRRLVAAAALAALPALVAGAAYAVPLRALGATAGPAGGAVLVAVVTFGQLTPGLPVGAAVYWSLAAWAARALGASASHAALLAFLTHAGMVLANLGVGVASAAIRRGTLRELFRRRREIERLAGGGGDAADAPPRAPT